MAAAQSPWGSFETRVLHFRFKKTLLKKQKMERQRSKECSVFFLWRKGSFSSRKSSIEEFNLVFFMAERMACFETKAAKFLLNFQVHFALYGQGKYVFER